MLNCLCPLAYFAPVLFLGRFHLVLLHLPIGILLLLAALEVACRFQRFKGLAAARGFIIGLAAISAAVTAGLGWLLATAGGYNADLLFWHRWLGTGVAVAALLAWAAWAWGKSALYYPLLVVAVVAMVLAAHFGGSLSEGSDYLTAYAPDAVRNFLTGAPTTVRPAAPKLAAHRRRSIVYSDIIQPIFAQNCIRCHGAHREKGGLRLDSYAYLMNGSHGRQVVIPGHPGHSVLIRRVSLPPMTRHRMPPGRRPGLTADQIAILRWWIRRGATRKSRVRRPRGPVGPKAGGA